MSAGLEYVSVEMRSLLGALPTPRRAVALSAGANLTRERYGEKLVRSICVAD